MASTNTQKSHNRRQDILAAAERVFAQRGFAEATVEEVAIEAGVSKGTMYNYFQSKKQLFADLFREAMTTAQNQLEEVVSSDQSARKKVDAILEMWFLRFTYYQKMGRLALEFWLSVVGDQEQGQFAGILHELYQKFRDDLAEILTQGVREGVFTLRFDPRIAASLILALLRGVGLQWILGLDEPDNEEYRSAIRRAVFGALTNPTDLPEENEL